MVGFRLPNEVTRSNLGLKWTSGDKEVMDVLSKVVDYGGMRLCLSCLTSRSMISTGSSTKNVEGTVDITEFFRKLKCVCHWADPFKDLKWSNVPGVMFSSLSEWMTPFRVSYSLQALSDLYYLFSGFMDYLWSREICHSSKFGPSRSGKFYQWFSALMFSSLIMPRFGTSRICDGNLRMVAISQSNLQAILSYSVVSCSTLYDQGLCWKEIL
ncbi:hypothetical protein Tco_1400398 [Tanacetum coccineum]